MGAPVGLSNLCLFKKQPETMAPLAHLSAVSGNRCEPVRLLLKGSIVSPDSDSPDWICFMDSDLSSNDGRVNDAAAAALSDLASSASSVSVTVIRAVMELSLPASLHGQQLTQSTMMTQQT